MIAALTFSIFIFFGYLFFIIYNYDIQTSISASYYALPVNRQFLFSLFCILYSVPIAYSADTVWFWLATLCVLLVGAAAAYRGDKLINIIHMSAAFMSVIFSHISMCLDYDAYYISGVSFVVALILLIFKDKILNGAWWAEIITYLAIVLTLVSKVILI